MTKDETSAQIKFLNAKVVDLENQIEAFDSAIEQNQYKDHKEAKLKISGRYECIASKECEGSYNYGADEYKQQYQIEGDARIFEASMTVEYGRHDKTYYYVDGFTYLFAVVA